MDIKLIMAIITITLALVFYTIGVFSERKAHILKKQESFHKFSIFVWLVWLVPYILGMIIGMGH